MGKVIFQKEYAQTPNLLLNDNTISLKAKGLFALMQSKPDDWNFSVSGLSSICKEDKDAISSGLRELENKGWLRRIKYQNEKGHWDIDYHFSNYPIFDKPLVGNPMSENPQSENTQNNNKERSTKKDLKKNTTTKEKIEVVEVPDFVKKEQEEKRKLAEEYTAGKLNEEETKESLYKDSKTQMAFKRLIAQDEKLSNLETTEEAFRHCFKTLIDETVFNASMKDDFPRSLVKSREHFLNFSRMIVSDKPERIKKLLIPR